MADAALPFGPCESGDECDSDYCVYDPDGDRVCTIPCRDDEDCPDDWECRAVANTRPDTVFICVAERQVQCLSCATDADCGNGQDRCIQIGRGLRCARNCSTEECPEGQTCQEVDLDGERAALCIPELGTCSPCVDMDGDGFGNVGDCPDVDCDDERPETYPGAQELCDGLDNDCDTRADEELAPAPSP